MDRTVESRLVVVGLIVALAQIAFAETLWVRQAPTSLDRRWRGIFGFDEKHAWAVGSRETVVETKDGGLSWIIHHTASTDSIPYNAVSFSSPNSGFIAGNGSSSLFTPNGGLSWEKRSGLSSIQADEIDFVSPTVGFARYGGFVAKTVNSGLDWTYVEANEIIHPFSMDFWDPNLGLVGGDEQWQGYGIWRTTNGGQSWTSTYPNAVNALLWIGATTAIAIDQGLVIRSQDGGQTWFPYGTIDGADIIRISRFGNSNALAGITADGAIYRSTDLGQTWAKVKDGLGHPLFPDRFASIHCANANVAWAVSDPGCIFRSLDQGLTWKQVSNSGTVAIQDMKMFDSKFGIAVGSPTYTMTTHDGGDTWKVQKYEVDGPGVTRDETFRVVDIVDENFAVAAGFGGIVFTTKDAGENWKSIGYPELPGLFYIFAADFITHDTGWVAGYDYGSANHMQNLYKTTDGGSTWTSMYTNVESQGFYQVGGFGDMFWIDSNRGFLTGTNSDPFLVRTLNGGQSWNRVPLPSNIYRPYINDIQFRNATEGWIVGGAGYVLKSTDSGQSWTKLNMGTDLNGFSRIVFPGPNKVWLFGAEHFTQRPMVYQSNNGGSTWTTEYVDNYPYTPQAATALNDGQVWVGTGMGTIQKVAHHLSRTAPKQMAIHSGTLMEGTVTRVSTSDNQYLKLRRLSAATLQSMQVEFTGFTQVPATRELVIGVESRCIGTIASEIVELYNWTTQSWERVLIHGPSSGDATFDVRITSRPSRFLKGITGEIKIRLTCRQEEPAFTADWDYWIDEVKFLVVH